MINGAAVGVGVPVGVDTMRSIDWAGLFALALAQGWFSPSPNGTGETDAVYVGVEVKNRAIADLYQTNFRVGAR